MDSANATLATVHPFERSGLGTAPFQFVRYEYLTYQACPGAPVQVGGSCDHCGTGIKDAFWIRGADGREFKVGSSCVYKTSGKESPLGREVAARAATARRDKARAGRELKRAGRELKRASQREARRRAWAREGAAKARRFLAEHPRAGEVRKALRRCRDTRLRSMAQKLAKWGDLSDAQISFAAQLAERMSRPELPKGKAPTGRATVTARIATTRLQDGQFGSTWKALYIVEDASGEWKAWGTLPTGLLGEVRALHVNTGSSPALWLRGRRIQLSATFAPKADDPSFAFAKRPNGRLL